MLLGSIAGYFGGAVDDVISRVVDVLMAFPGILLAIALVAVLGPSLTNVVLALSVIGWVGYARLVRGQALRAREFEFVQAARALGAGAPRIVLRHVLPTALPAVVVQATLGMAGAIIAEASLSFLGLGVQPPTPSWGTMLDAGRSHLFDAPHLTIFPGLAIATARPRLQLPRRRPAGSRRSEAGAVGDLASAFCAGGRGQRHATAPSRASVGSIARAGFDLSRAPASLRVGTVKSAVVPRPGAPVRGS